MKAVIKIVSVLILVSSFCSSSYAQNVNRFSLQQCIDYALQHQTQIKSAQIDVKSTLAQNKEITGRALPQVSANGNLQYLPRIPTQFIPDFISPAVYGVLIKEGVLPSDTKVPSGGIFPAAFGTKYSADASVSISQILFDGSVFVALQAKETVEELSRKSLQQTKRDVKVAVSKAYYNVLISKKQMALIHANIDRIKKLLHDTKIMYKNGFAEQLDIDRINVQLNNLKTQKVKLLNLLAVSDQLLKFQMGMPLDSLLTLTDTLSMASLKGALQDSTGFTYDQRIEYSLLKTQKRANEYNLKRYKMAALPSLSVFMNYGKNAGRNEFNFFDKDEPWFTTWIVGLSIDVPIFDGFQRKSRAKQARLSIEKNKIQLEGLEQSIDLQINQSGTTLRNNIINLESQEDNMKLAEKVYETAKKKYEQGVGSNIEVINAENDLVQAQTNYFSALYDAIIAKIDYKKALGRL